MDKDNKIKVVIAHVYYNSRGGNTILYLFLLLLQFRQVVYIQ